MPGKDVGHVTAMQPSLLLKTEAHGWDCLQAAASAVLQAVKARLTAQDQDQEVKECAVSCAAALVARLGDALQQEYSNLMQARPSPPCQLSPFTSTRGACLCDCCIPWLPWLLVNSYPQHS